jgi:hypothetical protein
VISKLPTSIANNRFFLTRMRYREIYYYISNHEYEDTISIQYHHSFNEFNNCYNNNRLHSTMKNYSEFSISEIDKYHPISLHSNYRYLPIYAISFLLVNMNSLIILVYMIHYQQNHIHTVQLRSVYWQLNGQQKKRIINLLIKYLKSNSKKIRFGFLSSTLPLANFMIFSPSITSRLGTTNNP